MTIQKEMWVQKIARPQAPKPWYIPRLPWYGATLNYHGFVLLLEFCGFRIGTALYFHNVFIFSDSRILRFSDSRNLRFSDSQNLRFSESQNLRFEL